MSEENKIIFKNKEHEMFYHDALAKCRRDDTYHRALVYCLGLSDDTRRCINQIYDFKSGCVLPECLSHWWVTSTDAKVIRLAFNLYNGGEPSAYDLKGEDAYDECSKYSVSNIFCTSYAPYFWQAIQIRYPEYTKIYDKDLDERMEEMLINMGFTKKKSDDQIQVFERDK